MLMHAYTPKKVSAPDLYRKYTWVVGLNLRWDDVGGISVDEISLLAEMVTIQNDADGLKARVASKVK